MKLNEVSRAVNAGGALVLMIGAMSITAAAEPTVLEHGSQIFHYWCAPCHGSGVGVFGPGGLPGTTALRLRYNGTKPAVLEERTDLQPGFVKSVVRHGIQAMPFFRKTEISDSDLDAISAYLARGAK